MRRLPLCALLVLITLGCSGGKGSATSAAEPSGVPEKPQSPYEQVRSGSFQLNQARDAVFEASQAAHDLPSSLGPARADIIEILDGVGESLGKHAQEPPAQDEFEKDAANQANLRLQAIDAANDSIHDLLEAKDVIAAAVETAKDKVKEDLETLDGLVDEAIDTLKSAIEAYGGKVEAVPEEQPEEVPQ